MDKEEADKLGELQSVDSRRRKDDPDETTSSTSGVIAAISETSPSNETRDHERPSPTEKKLYYYGLPTNPLLVARTGSTEWALPASHHDELQPKAMGNVGPSHRLVGIWESILDVITKALDPLDWTSIDLLRIGYQDTAENTWPVTLMIGVKPGFDNWDVAMPVAMACRSILRTHGVQDVECEIRQSDTFCCIRHRLHTVDEMAGRDELEKPFSECVGQSISPCAEPRREGSLGVYLAVGGERHVCALTCRHVVLGRLETESALKETFTDAGSHRYVAQPGKRFDEILTDAKNMQQVLGGDQPFLKPISAQQDMNDRRIGRVFFSPPRTLDDDSQLHDWLLVKLDAARYGDVSTLQNWLWVGKNGLLRVMRLLRGKHKPESKAGGNMIRLKGVVSKAEIFRTTTDDEPTQDHAALWVHMAGVASGQLTTGISNEVRSVRRQRPAVESQEIITSREWCVVGRNRRGMSVLHGVDSQGTRLHPFSIAGDSGSAVFDSQGRVAGILTSGCGFQMDLMQGTNNDFAYGDISYVTPIEVILDAIKTTFGSAQVL